MLVIITGLVTITGSSSLRHGKGEWRAPDDLSQNLLKVQSFGGLYAATAVKSQYAFTASPIKDSEEYE